MTSLQIVMLKMLRLHVRRSRRSGPRRVAQPRARMNLPLPSPARRTL